MKKIKHYFEFFVLKVLIFVVRTLPYELALDFGGGITALAYHLGIRKKVSQVNFELAFQGTKSKAERDKILLASYRNFGRSMAEYILLPRLVPQCLRRLVDISQSSCLQEIINQGKGALLVTGHLGSWEMLGASLVAYGFPVDFLVGEQANQLVDNLMNRTRERMGIGIIHLGVAARGVLKALKAGRMVALLSDQDAGHAGLPVKMFDKDVLTPGGAAIFSIKTNAPILVGLIVRNPDRISHRLEAKELKIPELTGDSENDAIIITQAYTDKLAENIKQYPEMWFWCHRRFKRVVEY